ncbi:MAG: hypothetical protein ACOCZH_06155 [Phototrophicaceae bacterium]
MSYTPLQLAEAFIQAGELADALDALNTHLAAEPADDGARRLRAAVRLRLATVDDLHAALADLDSLTEAQPHDAITRSAVLERLGDIPAALDTLRRAHGDAPDDDRLAERLLQLLRAAGHLADARALAQARADADLDDWRWATWAGDLAAALDDPAAAEAHYTRALATLASRYAIDTTRPARLLHDEGVSDAAALAVEGAYGRLLLARSRCLTALDRRAAAAADLDTAAAMLPDDPAIPFQRGLLAVHEGDAEAGRALVEQAFAMASPAYAEHLRADAAFLALRDQLGW